MVDYRKRIREICQKRRITFREISEKSGIPTSTLSRIMSKDIRNPGIQQLGKIADAIGIPLSRLFTTGKDDEPVCELKIPMGLVRKNKDFLVRIIRADHGNLRKK